MAYIIHSIPQFEREAKRLTCSVEAVPRSSKALVNDLKNEPEKGIPLGNNVFKIRLAIASKGKGKQGGARIIIYVTTVDKIVYLLSIYDKGEKASISDNEIQQLLRKIIL